jgi:hypothetical protein
MNAQKKNFRQGGGFGGVRSDRRPVVCKAPSNQVILNGFSIICLKTSVSLCASVTCIYDNIVSYCLI